MTVFSVKIVDHRSSTAAETAAVGASVSTVLGLAFAGTSDSVSVSWGAGSAGDNYVMHFVEDIAHSFLRTRWPSAVIDPNAAGHTSGTGSLSGTELYRVTPTGQVRLSAYGRLAFHEALHNLFPFRNDTHTAMGGGLAAANIPNVAPNPINIDFLRRGFSVKNPQFF